MTNPHRNPTSVLVLALGTLALLLGHAPASRAATPVGLACEKRVARELRACSIAVARQNLKCVKKTGALCPAGDAKVAASLARLESKVTADCAGGTTIADAGYPPTLSAPGLVDKLTEACLGFSTTLAARSFGGPHAAMRAGADAAGKSCLDNAFTQGRSTADYAFWQKSSCIQSAHAGRPCDPAKVAEKIAARQARATGAIARRCASLPDLVALEPATFAARSADQAECAVATAHGDAAPLALRCGPRAGIPVPPRGISSQVILDGDVWGTRCGDGSPFAFRIRLAPAGQPVEKVVVFIEGGGQCQSGPGCAQQIPDRFEALSDQIPGSGVLDSSAATNPFRDWTKIFIPYCTQDVHIGDGVTDVYPEMTVHRFGGRNVRAALAYARDVLWTAMDANDAEGFRPDRLLVFFSGSSAGGAGVQAHYHHVLDDLRWIHSTMVPDSSLGLDNGAGVSTAPYPVYLAWGGRAYSPPYCHVAECLEGWNVRMFAQAPRLKAVPEQQVLSVSNQSDTTQRDGGDFSSNAHFINTVRTKYCEQRGTPGLHAFLPDTAPQHGNIHLNPRFNEVSVQGILMRDWLYQAMIDPDGVIDRVGTTGYQSMPAVLPFPCDVASPSGAFVDGLVAGF